ncbi:MAG: hypothetical protein HPY53_10190 [Brevinematales bacterium]|nr:hypothetical protein [Brevinematales bacterium]
MKNWIAVSAIVMLFGAAGFAQMTDEQHLEKLMEEAKQNMDKKQGQTNSQQTVPPAVQGDGASSVKTQKTITVITVITQTSVVEEEVQNKPAPKEQAPLVNIQGPNVQVNIPEIKIPQPQVNVTVNNPAPEPSVFGPRPIGLGTFIIAEALGVCVPGFGLAHFTLGDTTGGMVCLAFTGVSVLSYIGAEIAVETRALDNPTAYSAWHWGSIALFAAGYLIDIIGAPVYYSSYNGKVAAFVKPLDVASISYDATHNDLSMNAISFGLEF